MTNCIVNSRAVSAAFLVVVVVVVLSNNSTQLNSTGHVTLTAKRDQKKGNNQKKGKGRSHTHKL